MVVVGHVGSVHFHMCSNSPATNGEIEVEGSDKVIMIRDMELKGSVDLFALWNCILFLYTVY